MKLTNNALLTTLKPLSLALLLAFSMSNAMAADEMAAPADNAAAVDMESAMVTNLPETYNNESWQTSTVTEFNKLDRSGNGLLLVNEASKGKAFNKKTFKQADTDNDGSIDVNEYVFFKTGKMPESAAPAISATPDEPMLESTP